MTLERIHNAYNHDGSELITDYFDVRFYGVVRFESAADSEWRKEQAELMAAKKAAREAAKPTGLYVKYSKNARRRVVHVLVEREDRKSVLACGARASLSSFGHRAEFGEHEVNCSRCAKRLSAVEL